MNLLAPVPWLKLLAAGVLFAGGLYLGVRLEKGRWDAATVAQERDYQTKLAAALKVSADRQAAVDAATQEKDSALQTLAEYRAAHPVHIGVCHPSIPAPTVSHNPPGEPAGTPPAAVLQPTVEDIGPALDALMAEADTVNENYRLCRSAYKALTPSVVQIEYQGRRAR